MCGGPRARAKERLVKNIWYDEQGLAGLRDPRYRLPKRLRVKRA